jgi:FkbM family methyltransferase
MKQLFFKIIFYVAHFFGIKKAMFYYSDAIIAYHQFKDIFLKHKYRIELNNPKVIIDIGSNVGLSLLYFKEQFGCADYVGIEPNPDAFRLLTKNCSSFSKLYNVATKDLEFKSFIYSTKDTNTSTLSPVGSITHVTDIIPCSTITKGYDNIDLVKISTNGSEVDILKDLQKHSQFVKIKNVIVETNTDNFTDIFNCLKDYKHVIKPFNNKTLIYAIRT